MGSYNIEKGEIRGIVPNGEAICLDCATNDDWQGVRCLEQIITIEDKKSYVCEKCGVEL